MLTKPEEEKQEARARKEEERAKKVESKRIRDEEKRRARDEKALSKVPVEAPKEEVVTEPVVTEAEPPILEPIPHVASIAPTEKPQIATEESVEDAKSQPLPGDEERLDPTFIPMSEMDEITASQANLVSADAEEPELEQMVTAETEISPTEQGMSGDAEAIARRVFAAPIENETVPNTALEPTDSETKELVESTSNVEEAPVVMAETATAPTVGSFPTPVATETTPAPVVTEPTPKTKHETPVATRIAPVIGPPVPAATTETTVSGPSTSQKPKESKGVSSWLKTKFSRRGSKPTKPETTMPATETKEKGFVGGANLTAPEASHPSSDHGDSSMREVAMAGKDSITAPTAGPISPESTTAVSPNDEDLYSASTRSPKATGAIQRRSTSSASISSLSSDEDTRGRSAIPREREPLTQQEFLKEELKSGEHVDPALVAGEQLDPALLKQAKGESSSAGGGEEFEEARDEFDSEKLSPPEKGVLGGPERKSDSPARDSKFLEDL